MNYNAIDAAADRGMEQGGRFEYELIAIHENGRKLVYSSCGKKPYMPWLMLLEKIGKFPLNDHEIIKKHNGKVIERFKYHLEKIV